MGVGGSEWVLEVQGPGCEQGQSYLGTARGVSGGRVPYNCGESWVSVGGGAFPADLGSSESSAILDFDPQMHAPFRVVQSSPVKGPWIRTRPCRGL